MARAEGGSQPAEEVAPAPARDDAPSAPARAWRRARDTVRRHPRRAVALAVLAIAALVLVFWWLPDGVDTVTVERREVVETLVATGRVRSASRTQLGPSLVGTVERVLAREGDVVAADEPVITLVDAEFAAAADEARARLAAAAAALDGLVSEELPTARAELEAAGLEAQQLARDVERYRVVLNAGGLSLQDMERAERAAEAARARQQRAAATVRGLSDGGTARSRAEAALVEAREALSAAEARLALTRIRSPAAGTVLTRDVEPGDAVQPGEVLMEIALAGPTELVVFADERSLSGLRPGQPARASADAYPDRAFAATVYHVAPVVDPEQATVEVVLRVPAPPGYLLPDMTVSVNIELGRRANAQTLPLGAVRGVSTGAPWVMAVRDGRATPVRVRVGARDGEFVEVLAGLREGERVVADPAADVEPGERVRARDAG